MKKKKFRKVVEWDNQTLSGEKWNDENVLWYTFWCMIPVVGQILWLILLIMNLCFRKVYWEEIKQ